MLRTLRTLCIVLAMAASATTLSAGGTPQLVNSCADGPHVGPYLLPLTTAPFLLTQANFDLTGAGCSNSVGINDAVLCFAPQNGCTLTIACDYTFEAPSGAGQYLNLFGGRCTHTPANCLAWDFASSNTQLTDIVVSAGGRYCVVCQDLEPGRLITVSLSASAGDCGLIDVLLFEDGFESGDSAAWSATVP